MSPFNPMQLLLYLGIAFLKLYSVLSSAKMQSKKYVNFQTITVSKKYCELEYRNKLDINPRESCKKARLVSQFQFYFKINVTDNRPWWLSGLRHYLKFMQRECFRSQVQILARDYDIDCSEVEIFSCYSNSRASGDTFHR